MKNRMDQILEGQEVHIAIEKRFTNVRIWLDDQNVYMRLDVLNQSSVPIMPENVSYAETIDGQKLLLKLSKFGFPANVGSLPSILEVLKDCKNRACRNW